MESPQAGVIRRMARATPARRNADGAAEVWRRTLPRVAADRTGLELAVTGVGERTLDLAEAVGEVGEGTLILALMEDEAPRGLAILDAGLMDALIEVQTTGRVSNLRRDPRAPTAVDAALARHVIDGWIAAAADARGDGAAPVTGRLFPDARTAMLALEEGEVQETRIDLDLAGGRRSGRLRLVAARERQAAAGPDPDALRATLLPVETTMHAVLCRVRLPLSQVANFAPGEVIPLDGVTPRRIRLEAPLGRLVAPAHLGQSRGHRAVRLLPPEEGRPPLTLNAEPEMPGASPWALAGPDPGAG